MSKQKIKEVGITGFRSGGTIDVLLDLVIELTLREVFKDLLDLPSLNKNSVLLLKQKWMEEF